MKKQVVIAHRGASGYLPEHTLASKAMAYAMYPDYIEQDLVLSKDDVPLVTHDIHLDAISDVYDLFAERQRADGHYYVIDFTFEELKQLRVTERFHTKTGQEVYSQRFPKGKSRFGLHSLQEEIELIQGLNKSTGKQIGIYPEIKSPEFHRKHGKDISKTVLAVLNEYGYTTKGDKCVLQCFDMDELKRIRGQLLSNLFMVQLLEEPIAMETLKDISRYADGIGPWYPHLLDEQAQFTQLVPQAHHFGMVVHPYTFRADQMHGFSDFDALLEKFLIDGKVDGVFTDFPDLAVQFLKKQNQ